MRVWVVILGTCWFDWPMFSRASSRFLGPKDEALSFRMVRE